MVMATLFAAEAFALANRPETKVRIHSWVKPPRRLAMKRHENARTSATNDTNTTRRSPQRGRWHGGSALADRP
jgi:hypothetical protein